MIDARRGLAGLYLVLATVALAACWGRSDDGELLVFAAASLNDALAEVEREFEARADGGVAFSYGGSQMLAQLISKGAPADVFIPAGQFPAESLGEEGLLEPGSVNLLSNRLVVVTRSKGVAMETMEQLLADALRRVAIADPDLAPAGRYAKESLMSLGLWEQLEGKLLVGADVRATLTYVETGNADAALVYETDAAIASGVRVYDVVPPDSYSPVVYPAVVIASSENKKLAKEFVDFLLGDQARAIFLRYGFALPGP